MQPRTLIFVLIGAIAVTARSEDTSVYIAPRSAIIPRSGKVVFDIYWVNRDEHSKIIPALEQYSFSSSSLPPDSGAGSANGVFVDHSKPDRTIHGQFTLHEHVKADVDAKPGTVVTVTATFYGSRSKFRSNTVLLRKLAKKT